MGWGGAPRRDTVRPKLTAEDRSALRREMQEIYLAIARDPAQPPMVRMAAAARVEERVADPFGRWD